MGGEGGGRGLEPTPTAINNLVILAFLVIVTYSTLLRKEVVKRCCYITVDPTMSAPQNSVWLRGAKLSVKDQKINRNCLLHNLGLKKMCCNKDVKAEPYLACYPKWSIVFDKQ